MACQGFRGCMRITVEAASARGHRPGRRLRGMPGPTPALAPAALRRPAPGRFRFPRTTSPQRPVRTKGVGHMSQRDGDAVTLRRVSRRYGSGDGAVSALDEVSLAFPHGSFTAVMGPSGSGKSTLLQCAAGLDRPTSGSVTVGGTELTGLGERRL